MKQQICVRCLHTGHQSHACKLPILPAQKSENPGLREQNGASIKAETKEKTA